MNSFGRGRELSVLLGMGVRNLTKVASILLHSSVESASADAEVFSDAFDRFTGADQSDGVLVKFFGTLLGHETSLSRLKWTRHSPGK